MRAAAKVIKLGQRQARQLVALRVRREDMLRELVHESGREALQPLDACRKSARLQLTLALGL
jgi:hypothetical protein